MVRDLDDYLYRGPEFADRPISLHVQGSCNQGSKIGDQQKKFQGEKD